MFIFNYLTLIIRNIKLLNANPAPNEIYNYKTKNSIYNIAVKLKFIILNFIFSNFFEIIL